MLQSSSFDSDFPWTLHDENTRSSASALQMGSDPGREIILNLLAPVRLTRCGYLAVFDTNSSRLVGCCLHVNSVGLLGYIYLLRLAEFVVILGDLFQPRVDIP